MSANVTPYSVQSFSLLDIQPDELFNKEEANFALDEELKSKESSQVNFDYLIQEESFREAHEMRHSPLLSKRLRTGIGDVHKIAIQNPFLKSLMEGGGAFCSKAFVHYLCSLFVVHKALEEGQRTILQQFDEGYFVFLELFRSQKLLNDIKIWSIFNETEPLFADLDISSPQFRENVEKLAEKEAKELAEHIRDLGAKNPLHLIGVMYALYGTTMSGGQAFKKGLQNGFAFRLENGEEDENPSLLREKIFKEAKSSSNEFLESCVTFFSFPKEMQPLRKFKEDVWHKTLDEVLDKLAFKQDEEKERFIARLVEEANYSINGVLKIIASMLTSLKNKG